MWEDSYEHRYLIHVKLRMGLVWLNEFLLKDKLVVEWKRDDYPHVRETQFLSDIFERCKVAFSE